jgi:hypothetical protein
VAFLPGLKKNQKSASFSIPVSLKESQAAIVKKFNSLNFLTACVFWSFILNL